MYIGEDFINECDNKANDIPDTGDNDITSHVTISFSVKTLVNIVLILSFFAPSVIAALIPYITYFYVDNVLC